ncbi:MtrAB system histidine kinase MtrB [Streptomyces sp. LHD-70]|uniref:MtrAB system histidine kinase MtrB n=1 Tax=Streptomyces sp. LHD-70 TaxID=3072140 RepID=UPI00280E0537|nr:MtrAB system histidine kinase MtrB [Streptomyces sp. LHD-70]MDQ8705834.1 MtrAB system histidine kinase MtrB [Streptomyces sp. LHD-70]
MSRDSAASAPGEPGNRQGRPVSPSGRTSRFGRLIDGGLVLQDGVQGSPVLRLFTRWVRRPLLPVMRLWRRNIQLRVVAATLVMSLGVVLLLGFVVIGQVRNGLLDAKEKAAQIQATGGFKVAQENAANRVGAGSGGAANGDQGKQNAGLWRSDMVTQLSSGGQSAFHVVALAAGSDAGPGRAPRASGYVEGLKSVPNELRTQVDRGDGAYQSFSRIVYTESGPDPVAGLVIGKRMTDINNDPYQLYYLFPLTQEEKSLSLVKGTLATAGLFVVVLLGAIAWLVVRQVVTPVRMAAGIAERLSAGRLQERMKVTGEDDIARLGEAFNKMAQNLQLKIQQLEDLSRMQRRFVSDVSHELRTPLTTVRMAADVIHEARVDFDPVTARSAELLADQLDRFESLLADLLEISRFDAGAAALEAEPTDLRDVVRRVVGGAEPLAEAKGGRIRVVGDEQPVVAEADARRVERVLRNLVVNAVEHGDGKDVIVRLGAAGGAVAVAVRDYGVGLKPGEATRVFNRFWRADPARARTTGGTGLGLSIALEDARLHGGWLQAWGEPGGGSQFRLTLPRTADEALRGSPIPLEPEDSRRNRGLHGAGLAGGAQGKQATVPAQPVTERGPVAVPPTASSLRVTSPSADPTALPGSGARVVPRQVGSPEWARGGSAIGGPASQRAAEPATDAVTGPSAEPAMEAVTGPSAEPATEAATEPPAIVATEPRAEAATEPTAEAATGPATESTSVPAPTSSRQKQVEAQPGAQAAQAPAEEESARGR